MPPVKIIMQKLGDRYQGQVDPLPGMTIYFAFHLDARHGVCDSKFNYNNGRVNVPAGIYGLLRHFAEKLERSRGSVHQRIYKLEEGVLRELRRLAETGSKK